MKKRLLRGIAWMLAALTCLALAACASDAGQLQALQEQLIASENGDMEDSGEPPRTPEEAPWVYVLSLGKRDCDFYEGHPLLAEDGFLILSKTPLDAESVRVEIPMETQYEVFTYASAGHENLADSARMSDPSCLETYLCAHDADWAELGQATKDYNAAQQRLYWKNSPETEAEDRRTVEAYEARQQELMQEAMEAADSGAFFPEFYTVSVTLSFHDMVDETVDSLILSVGKERRRIPLGQWRFHAALPADLGTMEAEGVSNSMDLASNTLGTPDDGGLVAVASAFDVTTTKPITLEKLQMEVDGAELLGALVETPEADAETLSDFGTTPWDCGSEMEIPAGRKLQVSPVLRDADFAAYGTRKMGWIHLEYRCDGETHKLSLPCDLQMFLVNEAWMIALRDLYGNDLMPYYQNYFSARYNYLEPYRAFLNET